MRRAALCRFACIAAILAGGLVKGDDTMQSPGYRLAGATLDPAGDPAASPGFLLNEALGVPLAGPALSPRFTLQWGVAPFNGPVMSNVRLDVAPGSSGAGSVRLTWTGQESPFTIYRSTDCATLLAPANVFTLVPGNSFTDPSPPVGALVCYNVRGTAPD